MSVQFTVKDGFWSPLMEKISSTMIPYQWNVLHDKVPGAVASHCAANFRIAAGLEQGTFQGYPFQDTDAYKWLEAVAYSLSRTKDASLEQQADGLIDLIAAAQQPDGYLDTYYIINGLDDRFTNLMDNHELYCAGHLLEAGVAYYEATGKDRLLTCALNYVDCIRNAVNDRDGLPGYPGHEVLEMALLRCYRLKGEAWMLDYAGYLLSRRGTQPSFFLEEAERGGRTPNWMDGPLGLDYYQAAMPVRRQRDAVGHAVRAVYLYSAMADYCALTGDEEMKTAIHSIWQSMTGRRMYITGGIGSSAYGESFTFDYDLPLDTCYCETCAAIGAVFFADRMFALDRRRVYHDVIERIIYNALPAGMNEDATQFFYTNPLEVVPRALERNHAMSHIKNQRQPWFECACCPPNMARLIASIGRYAVRELDGCVYINQYISGKVSVGGGTVTIESNMPWDGKVRLTLKKVDRPVMIRIPGWSRYTRIIGDKRALEADETGYAAIPVGTSAVNLYLDMTPAVMQSCDSVRASFGKLAFMRGPVVYCAEETDNGAELHRLYAGADCVIETGYMGDMTVLDVSGWRRSSDTAALYRRAGDVYYERKTIRLVPYYYWANREPGEMRVWLNERC